MRRYACSLLALLVPNNAPLPIFGRSRSWCPRACSAPCVRSYLTRRRCTTPARTELHVPSTTAPPPPPLVSPELPVATPFATTRASSCSHTRSDACTHGASCTFQVRSTRFRRPPERNLPWKGAGRFPPGSGVSHARRHLRLHDLTRFGPLTSSPSPSSVVPTRTSLYRTLPTACGVVRFRDPFNATGR